MSKTLTEIAQIISKVEDDLYDKADEMVALKQRIRELKSALLNIKASSVESHILQIVEETLEPRR